MAGGLKEIKARINSIKNIHKITKAMELVSVSKMRRAVEAVNASRPYARHSWEVLNRLAQKVSSKKHPLLAKKSKLKKLLIIMITSDRGLCGSFNIEIIRMVEKFIKEVQRRTSKIDLITIGKKGRDAVARKGWLLKADFANLSFIDKAEGISPLANLIMEGFKNKEYDGIFIAYTDFVSTIKQIPRFHQLLPLHQSEFLGEAQFFDKKEAEHQEEKRAGDFEFIFEPNVDEVLDFLVPRLLEVQIYQAILESTASEHSARMMAMKNASDAASDMADELTFSFNQLRQAAITREIAEISSGKAVLEHS